MTALIRARPYLNAARRRVSGPRPLARSALSVEEIAPAERGFYAPVTALPGERDRVRATLHGHDLGRHLRYFDGQEVEHAPVRRYVFEDVLVFFNGYATPRRTYNRWGPLDHRALLTGPVTPLDRAAYCLEDRSYHYFGHWVRSFAQCLLARPEEDLLHFHPPGWTHAPAYERGFGIASPPPGLYRIARMSAFQDYGQGRHKGARYLELRRRLQAGLPAPAAGPKRVYLRRGQVGSARHLADEARLEDLLVREGFSIVDVGTPPEALFEACHGADLAIAVEGSHADHLHWLMRPGGTLFILNPADRFNTSQFAVAQTMGNRTATMVIEPAANGIYGVDHDRLKATLDLIGG